MHFSSFFLVSSIHGLRQELRKKLEEVAKAQRRLPKIEDNVNTAKVCP